MIPPRSVDDLAAYPARLGLTFRDVTVFQQALTHGSYLNENPGTPVEDNERLEYLGDAIVHFLAAEWLFLRMPNAREGVMTRLRSALVRNVTLAEYSKVLGLGDLLLMGRGEEDNGGRARPRTLGGAFEALLAALYLDQGMAAARAFVEPYFERHSAIILAEASDKDAKSRLQEWCQRAHGQMPRYEILSRQGPEHSPEFSVQVWIGDTVYGSGRGRSKQAASQAAAQAALTVLQTQGQLPDQAE